MEQGEARLVMIIDDVPAQSRLIAALAARDGWHAIVARDPDSALAMLETRRGLRLSAIILDDAVPGDDAGALIAALKARRPALPVLLLTTAASPLSAVTAMRAGASDYLVKPVAPDRIMLALRSVIAANRALHAELQPLSEKLAVRADFDAMIGASPAFRNALAIAAKAARGHAPILVEGECGTGKEMLARAIHAASARARTPLRLINLAAIPAGAVESTLFGHEQGSFPGAFDRRIGAIQQCDGGTLVLDEIDRLPLAVQHRLRDAVQRGDCRPIGARHSFRVDVRYVFAADLALDDPAGDGLFDAGLLQAISAVSLTLPPLRERREDIAALARHFLSRIGDQPGLRPLGITDQALALLAAYAWPGNVRQLQAALLRAAVFCAGDALTAQDFPQVAQIVEGAPAGGDTRRQDSSGITLFAADGNLRPLDEIEADVIRLAIGHYRGRMAEVARRLGIGRSTLYRKLSELGIDNAA